jgi:general secretion pathway protein C
LGCIFLYDEVMSSASKFFFTSPSTFLHFVNFLVWAGVAFSSVVLLLHWRCGAEEGVLLVASTEQKQVLPDVDALAVSKALGAAPVQSASASLASRFVLVGVMDGGPAQGVALISVDGKPAKPFRLGQTVTDGFVVLATGPKKAELGPQLGASSSLVLELPVKK